MLTDEKAPALDFTKPIDMEIFFKAPLDDIDDYCQAREDYLRNLLPPEERKRAQLKTKDFLPETESSLTAAIQELIHSGRKFGMSKRTNVLSLRVAYDLVDKKHRMVLMERLPEEAIYTICIMGQAMKLLAQGMAGFHGMGSDKFELPTGTEIRELDPKALDDLPQEVRQQLLEVITELKKKLEDGNAY